MYQLTVVVKIVCYHHQVKIRVCSRQFVVRSKIMVQSFILDYKENNWLKVSKKDDMQAIVHLINVL